MGKLAGQVVLVILAAHVTGMDDDGHNFDDLLDSPDERLDFLSSSSRVTHSGQDFDDNEYTYLLCCSVSLFVCLFVSNKRRNRWNDRAQILCVTSHAPREGEPMIKFPKLASNKIRFLLKF